MATTDLFKSFGKPQPGRRGKTLFQEVSPEDVALMEELRRKLAAERQFKTPAPATTEQPRQTRGMGTPDPYPETPQIPQLGEGLSPLYMEQLRLRNMMDGDEFGGTPQRGQEAAMRRSIPAMLDPSIMFAGAVAQNEPVQTPAQQMTEDPDSYDSRLKSLEKDIRAKMDEPVQNRKTKNWLQRLGRGFMKFTRSMEQGGSIMGSIGNALDPIYDERMNKQRNLNEMLQQFSTLNQMRKAGVDYNNAVIEQGTKTAQRIEAWAKANGQMVENDPRWMRAKQMQVITPDDAVYFKQRFNIDVPPGNWQDLVETYAPDGTLMLRRKSGTSYTPGIDSTTGKPMVDPAQAIQTVTVEGMPFPVRNNKAIDAVAQILQGNVARNWDAAKTNVSNNLEAQKFNATQRMQAATALISRANAISKAGGEVLANQAEVDGISKTLEGYNATLATLQKNTNMSDGEKEKQIAALQKDIAETEGKLQAALGKTPAGMQALEEAKSIPTPAASTVAPQKVTAPQVNVRTDSNRDFQTFADGARKRNPKITDAEIRQLWKKYRQTVGGR